MASTISYFHLPKGQFLTDTLSERADVFVAHLDSGDWRLATDVPATAALLAEKYRPWDPEVHGHAELADYIREAMTDQEIADYLADGSV